MVLLSDLFNIEYGHSLELNRLKLLDQKEGGIAFISRKMGDNGISAYVAPMSGLKPATAGQLTCALSGNGVLSTFLQDHPFYTGFHVACLRPRTPMTRGQLLFYCTCIAFNRYRFSYGRQANRTLKSIVVPSFDEIPSYVQNIDLKRFERCNRPATARATPTLDTSSWLPFELQVLFEIKRGKGPRKRQLDGTGTTVVVTSSDANNGVTGVTAMPPTHDGNTIGVNRNGSVGEAFYQPHPFCSTEDVHIFTPKFKMNSYIGLFLATIIRMEKFRFGYGRKWGLSRMKTSTIYLPVTKNGEPDWRYMEKLVKTLPFSSQV